MPSALLLLNTKGVISRWGRGLDLPAWRMISIGTAQGQPATQPDYYREILATLGVSPEQSLMAGNDVSGDMIAESLGLQVFLMTDCLIIRILPGIPAAASRS